MELSELDYNRYQRVHIYFFSGTGNSRNVALWLSDFAKSKNIDVTISDIAKKEYQEQNDSTVLNVIISPIHGFNYPPVVLDFLMRFPKGKSDVVLMNTRAGMLIGKFITPGLTGIAFYFASLILIIKGYTINGFYPIDLPSNWISVHPGLNDRTVSYLHERNRDKVRKVSATILSGRKNFLAMLEIYDILLLPIALGYYIIGRFIFAKTYYASRDCDNCGVCIKGCPVGAIKEVGGRPFWTLSCESCMKCMSNCPKKAIETGHGLVAITAFLYTIIISYFAFDIEMITTNGLLGSVVESLLFLAVLVIVYYISHFLIRISLYERLIVWTSLTKYKFWGKRYKAKKWNE